jgi:hypothetical protein
MTLEWRNNEIIEVKEPQTFKQDKLHSQSYITKVAKTLSEADTFEKYEYDPMEVYFYGKKYELK